MGIVFPNESPQYRAERDELLGREIALRREMESVAVARRALPPGGVLQVDYVFDELDANWAVTEIKLSELFAPGKDALVIYNYMFPRHVADLRPGPQTGESAKLPLADGPCPSCTNLIDQLDGAAPLVGAHANMVVAAKAPIERVAMFGRERGWRHIRLLPSGRNSFARDYNGEIDGMQMPMMNVFTRDGDSIRHFWGAEMLYAPTDPDQDPRSIGPVETAWNLFDLMPQGRGIDWHEQLDYDDTPTSQPR